MKNGKIYIEKFILDNFHYPYAEFSKEIAEQFGVVLSRHQIFRVLRGATLKEVGMTKPQVSPREALEAKFRKFLIKARTEAEIAKKLGEEGLKLLGKKWGDLNLFEQVNWYGERVYILLPKPAKRFRLKPKAWQYHIGADEEGNEQPYLVCQLPTFRGKLIIFPMYDIHFGHEAHRKEKFLQYLRWIKETPNVYVILGGDLMENAIDDGRGMSYDQETPPQSQFDQLAELLAPIAHKILVAVPGNHEHRTYKKTGVDVAQLLAQRLDIPYFQGPVLLTLLANGYKWNFYVRHGTGNAQTKGGKMNMAARPKGWTAIIHFFVSGHVHDAVAEAETLIVDDPINCRLVFLKQWIVVASSFLSWYKTYAYRAEYKPPASGGVSMELYENGEYKAELTS